MIDQAQKLRELVKKNIEHKDNEEEFYETKVPKVITVSSGKGGVGKSNIVVNLSIALSEIGAKVLIFDADMGMSNDHLLMGKSVKYNVFDLINNSMNIEEVIVKGPLGVKLISGGSALSRIDTLSENERDIFLKKISSLKDYDFILIDTGAGVNKDILGFIACSDEFIVVTTPEPTSITDAYSLVKVVSNFKIKDYAKIIINKTLTRKEGTSTYARFSAAARSFLDINTELLGCICNDEQLVQAVRKQVPTYIEYPSSSFSVSIKYIAWKLFERKEKPIKNSNLKENNGFEGFFKKLFNIFS